MLHNVFILKIIKLLIFEHINYFASCCADIQEIMASLKENKQKPPKLFKCLVFSLSSSCYPSLP